MMVSPLLVPTILSDVEPLLRIVKPCVPCLTALRLMSKPFAMICTLPLLIVATVAVKSPAKVILAMPLGATYKSSLPKPKLVIVSVPVTMNRSAPKPPVNV